MKAGLVILTFLALATLRSEEVLGQQSKGLEIATFGAGCFWGVEKLFAEQEGVVSTRVGYLGGDLKNPSYEQVCSGRTGHAEVVEITFDPARTTFAELLQVFWSYHDPTTLNRQGNDIGTQYRSAIFYHSEEQRAIAERSKAVLEKARIFKDPIVTEIVPASDFYAAEEYHQKYLKKNPFGYCNIHLQSAKIKKILAADGMGKK